MAPQAAQYGGGNCWITNCTQPWHNDGVVPLAHKLCGGGVLEKTGIQLERKLISAVSVVALARNSIGA